MAPIKTTSCRRIYQKQWAKDNAEHLRQYKREWARCQRQDKTSKASTWAKRNPERRKEHLLRYSKYGLSYDEWKSQLAEQEGLCAICKQPESARRGDTLRELSIDHDHVSGRVRGLLCSKCNTAIGLFDEDLSKMIAAIAYLTRHKGRDALCR